jgi:alginate O-acetyltransferase complex protein AlgI
MVFSSVLFLFLFLPVTLAAYYTVPERFRNWLLLLVSLLFYLWGEGIYILVMLASVSSNYVFARLIDSSTYQKQRKRRLFLAISSNLGILIFFKYINFIVDNLNEFLSFTINIDPVHLPIGISFFTFQAMSYVIDVYRKDAYVEKSFANVALYVSLFPQLIAGPIVRYHDVAQQIVSRKLSSELFAEGVQRFILGLSKKVLIANTMGKAADEIFLLEMTHLSPELAWLGIICYALQLYFDFSAYSDMAIGLGMMFGFRFLENFNYPYISKSIQEFWQRWHMSLSRWFRDYLYIPLGGNRVSPIRVYFNLFIVFFLCGLWHGASWNFVIWGMIHGVFLITERMGFIRVLDRLWSPLRHSYVLIVVLFSWVFFRAETLPQAVEYSQTMLGMAAEGLKYPVMNYVNVELKYALIFGLLCAMPLFPNMQQRIKSSLAISKPALVENLSIIFYAGLLLICSMYLAAETYNPFIYFRF